MAMLTRPTNIKIFGSAALAAELTDFGGSTPSTDINTILNSVAAERGWGTVGANGFPPMEWFNALGYALSYYSAYIMQSGIPAWTSLQNYYVNSYAVGSDGKIYRSKTGINGTPNVGNNPVGDTTNWESTSDMAGAIHNATAENPGDTDEFGYWDSLTTTLRKVTLSNLKATLKTYFDTLYLGVSSVLGFANMPAGSIIQVANYTTGTVATGTTTIPMDNTIPQITEGTQFMSLVFTPKKANSKLRIHVVWMGNYSTSTSTIVALFDGSTNAIGSMPKQDANTTYPNGTSFDVYYQVSSTSPITFTVRAGGAAAGTITFNGYGGAQYLGGNIASSITIEEIAQ